MGIGRRFALGRSRRRCRGHRRSRLRNVERAGLHVRAAGADLRHRAQAVRPRVLQGPVVLRRSLAVPVALESAAGFGDGRRRGGDIAERECDRSSGQQCAFHALVLSQVGRTLPKAADNGAQILPTIAPKTACLSVLEREPFPQIEGVFA
jgi:hypothetical protein